MVLCLKLLCLHAYPIHVTCSLIIYLQITLRKITKILLFIIYINDLSIISDTLECTMYADDTTIYLNTEDFPKDNLAKHSTTELDEVDVWLKHNKLSLNAEKQNV